ncbi:hypothetical protein [Aquimarina addita]
MNLYKNEFCKMEFYTKFVIITFIEDFILTLSLANQIREKLCSYYGDENFIMINNRVHPLEISKEVYKHGQLANMKGLAFVSKQKTERDKALIEQRMFDKSFAFFEDLENAKSWANSYF